MNAGFADPKGLIKAARKKFLGVDVLPHDHDTLFSDSFVLNYMIVSKDALLM